MNPPLACLAAYVFQATGRRRVNEEDWIRLLSLERKWIPPTKVRALVSAARARGYLRNAGDRDFEPGLEAEGILLPVDYRPDLAQLETALVGRGGAAVHEPLFLRIVRTTAKALGQAESEVVARVNLAQEATGGLLTAEVAALYDARLQGVDVAAFFDEAEASLLK